MIPLALPTDPEDATIQAITDLEGQWRANCGSAEDTGEPIAQETPRAISTGDARGHDARVDIARSGSGHPLAGRRWPARPDARPGARRGR